MAASESFNLWLTGLRAGDGQAAQALFERFAQRMIGLARGRLDGRLAGKVDAEDVVQSAWKSFFTRHANGRFELTGWDELWGLLVRITLRKCIRCHERFYAEKRHIGREQTPPPADSSSIDPWEGIDREPTPAEAAELAELVEGLMRRLVDDADRQILSLRLQGHTVLEIGERLGRSERTVERRLEQVRKWLEEH